MASLQHLGTDRYRIRVYAGGSTDGKERLISRSFRARNITEARRQAAAIETKLRESLAVERAAAEARRGSIRELVEDWLTIKERDASPTTMRGYHRHADKILARFGNMAAVDLTGRDIDRWYSDLMATGTTAAGIQHLHRVFRAALRWAYMKRDLPTIATDKATPPQHLTPELRPPTNHDVRAILAALPDKQWTRAVALLIFTGMRRGEVVGLRWEDWAPGRLTIRHSIVEVRGKGIEIRTPKGKKSRTVGLDPLAEVVLTRQREWLETTGRPGSPWVFPDLLGDTTGDSPRRPGWVSLMWGRWRAVNAPGVRLHSLRHHYATLLLDGGTPINTVQGWLGHADASTTIRIYGHRTTEGEALGLSAIQRALSPVDSPAP